MDNTTGRAFLSQGGDVPVVQSVESFSGSMLEILGRRRWTILATSIITVAAGALYLQRATPQYTSTSRIDVEQTGPQIFEKDTSGAITRWDNYLYTQAERLKSTEILSAALASPGMSNLRMLANVGHPIGVIRRGLVVNVGKKDEIINISFTSVYPDEAARVVNAIVDAYITVNERHKRSTFGEVVRVLREGKDKHSEELVRKVETMVAFRQQHEGLALGTDQDSNIIVQRLERLSAALTEAQLTTVERASFYEAAQKMSGRPLDLRQLMGNAQWVKGTQVLIADETLSLRNELREMEHSRDASLHALKPDHPGIAAINAEIERRRSQLDALDAKFAESFLMAAEQEHLIARQKEEELRRRYEQQRQEAIMLNNQLAQYTILQSDYEQTKRMCDLLDSTIQRFDVSTEVGTMNIGVLETATPSLQPSEPQVAKTMGLALFLGLFSGLMLSFVREWRDQRLRSTWEISALLDLPVLGAIPSMSWPKQTPAIRGQKVRIRPDSREAEAFRIVRTAIFFRRSQEDARTIQFTSPLSGEGKSTIVANLGIAIAQAGQKVLILDADLRSPMQDKIFALNRQARGLSWVLTGEMSAEDAIEHTKEINLDVLTCGPDISQPAEALNSRNLSLMLTKLAAQYDWILIDSPPIIAIADGLILAALCDISILVLHAEISTRQASVQAGEALASVNATVLGVVVNDVPQRGNHYGYYHVSRGKGRQKKKGGMTVEAIEGQTAASILPPHPGDPNQRDRNEDGEQRCPVSQA